MSILARLVRPKLPPRHVPVHLSDPVARTASIARTMSEPKHVLIAGLDRAPPAGSAAVRAPAGTPEQLRAKVAAVMQQARDAGYAIEAQQSAPDELDAFVEKVRGRLAAQKWACFVVGFGIRGVPDYSEAFERLVNAGRELAPETPMAFNARPDDTLEAIERVMARSGT